MRLLNTATLEVEFLSDEEIRPYAILSHRWQSEEVTLEDVEAGIASSKKGYEKVKRCCAVARANGLDYAWIDTLCIDKRSSAELSEAINSMYRWYQQSAVCYAYLADVTDLSELPDSEWFCRGWTLQELLAPSEMHFFDANWQNLDTKDGLVDVLSKRTGISIGILSGKDDLETASIAQRMCWAATRKTTRVEDRAYSLMGIFGINMPLLYGEGNSAFIRLQEEILKISDDDSIFAWQSEEEVNDGVLATTPDSFKDSAMIESPSTPQSLSGPLTISNKGIHLEVRFIGLCSPGIGLALLQCKNFNHRLGRVFIYLRDLYLTMQYFERVECHTLGLLDLQVVSPSQYPMRKICIKHRYLRPTAGLKAAHEKGMKSGMTPRYLPREFYLSRTSHDYLLAKMLTNDRDLNVAKVDEHGMSALLDAAASGESHQAWLLLTRSDVRIDQKDNRGQTALTHAIIVGDEETLNILLAQPNIDIDCEDNEGLTPLSHAVMEGRENIVQLLLNTGRFNIGPSISGGYNPFLLCLQTGKEKISKLLLNHGTDIEAKDSKGQTALLIATERRSESMLAQLIMRGANLETKSKDGLSALSLAAKIGNKSLCELLLKSGAYLETHDNAGMTPLAHAAKKGSEPVVTLLLDWGAVVDAKTLDGQTPLVHAAINGHESVVKLLLNNGADCLSHDASARTPLLWAVGRGREKLVKHFIDAGAEVHAKDASGSTALLVAAAHSYASIARLLLEKGADVEDFSKQGRTPLLWASITGNESFARLLLEHGANPNNTGGSDRSPLWNAVFGNHMGVVQALLEHGVDQQEKNTLLCDAANQGKEPLVRLLIEHGADIHFKNLFGSPLRRAIDKRHEAIVKLLVELGADVGSEGEYRKREIMDLLNRDKVDPK